MRVNKTQALLFIFYRLLKNKRITKAEVLDTVELNDLTFKRYMQELRAYFANFDLPYVIHYDRSENAYFLRIGDSF